MPRPPRAEVFIYQARVGRHRFGTAPVACFLVGRFGRPRGLPRRPASDKLQSACAGPLYASPSSVCARCHRVGWPGTSGGIHRPARLTHTVSQQ